MPPDDQWWSAAPLVQQSAAPAKPSSGSDQWWAAAPLARRPDATTETDEPPAKRDEGSDNDPMALDRDGKQSQLTADENALASGVIGGVGSSIQGAGQKVAQERLSDARQKLDTINRILGGQDMPAPPIGSTGNEPVFAEQAGYAAMSPDDLRQAKANLEQYLAKPPAAPGQETGQAVSDFGTRTFPVDKANEGWQTKVLGTVGNVGATAATGLVAGAVGGPLASAAVIAPQIFAQSYDSTYKDAISKGATPEQADQAASTNGLVQSGMMALPVGRLLSAVPAPIRDGFAKTLWNLGLHGVEFGSANAASNFASNYIASQTYDPARPLTAGVMDAGKEGFLAGLIVRAAGIAAKSSADALMPKTQPLIDGLNVLGNIAAGRPADAPPPPDANAAAPAPPGAGGAGAPPPPGAGGAGAPPPAAPAHIGQAAQETGANGAHEMPNTAPETAPNIPNVAPELNAAPPAPPNETGAPNPYAMLRPGDLTLDPKRFQYKESDPDTGVTGALAGVKQWEPALADPIDAYRDTDGKLYVVNGHQRTDLAKRAEAAGQPDVQIPARIYDAADGYTPEAMRAMGAYRNIAQGSGTALDAAKVLRAPPVEGFTLPELPPKSALVQQGQGLAKLSDDAFGAVVNGVVPAPYAAEVGRAISDPAQQMAAIQILHQAEPANAEQARLLVQDVKNSGFLDGTQEDMFGSQAFAQSLFPERAKVLGQALQTLRGNKKVFQSAVAGEDTLAAAGNTLDTEANQKGQTENERLIDTLQRGATTRGPLSDALSAAARDVASGKQVRGASADFLAKARALVRSGAGAGLEHGADNERAGQAGAAGADGAAAPGVEGPGLLSNRQGAAGAGAADTPAHFPAFQAVAEHVMRLAGVPKSVTLKLFERLNDGTADGSYAAELLKFALDTDPSDIPAKFFHEIVHALRDPALGLLKPGERAALDRAAEKWLRQGDNRARTERLYGTDAATVHEEAIARLAEEAVNRANAQPGYITRIADRMMNFVRSLGSGLRGQGFKTADDVFNSILSGKRTGERVAPEAGPAVKPEMLYAKREPLISDKAALEKAGQGALFGRQDAAVQAQAARDAQRGLTGRGEQKAADEGLFAPRATSFGQPAHDTAAELIKWGKANGREALRLYDPMADEITHQSTGSQTYVTPTSEMVIALADPRNAFVVQHNHPNSMPLSYQDITQLAHPGLSYVIAHAHDGNLFGAKLGSMWTERNGLARDQALIVRAFLGTERAVRGALDAAAQSKRITYAAANRYYNDVLARILDAGHVIDYTSSWTMPEEIAKITQEIAGKLTNAVSNDRLTQSFRPDEGLARIVADARSIAEQRRGDANVNPDAAQGNSAPQSPPPAWRPPVGKGDQGRLFSLRDQEKVAGLDGFYSGVARAALDMKQGKGTGEQMLAMLQKAPGVKPEEMKWLGLPEWLHGQKSVTRDDIVNYVRANSLVAKETVLADPNRIKPLEQRLRAAGITKPLDEISLNDLLRSNADQELYDDFSDALFGYKGQATVYSRYKTEGGENYNELLISLPPSNREGGLSYKRGHWGEPNVIAHTRFDERIGADGKRTLLVHEIQSDWHQEGRRKGYQPPADERKALEERYQEIEDEDSAAREIDSEISAEKRLEWARIKDLLINPERVPDAPFKTSWPMLTMKRLIKWAVDNNFDRVAWEPGQVQVDRYKLSKQVGRLDYIPTTNELHAFGYSGKLIHSFSDATPDRLPKLIGKETAQKLLAQQERPLPGGRSHQKQLTGIDLKLGGEGMKGFYDEILPKETQKLIGKYGAQVKSSKVSKGLYNDPIDYFHPFKAGEDGSYRVVNGRGEDYNEKGRYSHDDAYALADRVNQEIRGHEVFETHSFDITPAMRAAVTQDGLPLFSLRGDGRDPAERKRNVQNLHLALTTPSRAGASKIRAIANNAKAIFSPTSLAGAKPTEHVVRRNAARLAASYARTVADLSDLRDAMNALPVEEQYAFTARMEKGERQPTPELQAISDLLRASYDSWAKLIQSLGKGYLEQTIANYAPHIWANYKEWVQGRPADATADPKQRAAAAGASKSPVQGSGAFLEPRSFETQEDGMRAGLVPVSSNPIDLAMIKLREMQKMYHGTRMIDDMRRQGIAHWVPVGKEGDARAAGMVELNDQGFKPTVTDKGGRTTYGSYWADENAARIFNNYTSKGWGGQPIYDAIRASGNALNQLQLGLSAFHAIFVTLDCAISRVALGYKQIARGDVVKGAGNVVAGATPGVGQLATAAQTVRRGSALRQAILYPEAATPELRKIADLAMAGGARVAQQQILRAEASGSFVRNLGDFTNGHVFREIAATVRKSPLMAPLHLAGRTIETMAQPLMDLYVPRAKLGVFYDMAHDWAQANPDATPEQTADAMTKAWDSVDNRMGQLVYDNLFWNKTMKDLAFITTRSVGWNLGTVRELGGAGVDTVAQLANVMQRKPADLTHRMAYALAMPTVIMPLGAVITYMITGAAPQSLKDYFYPPDGKGGRLSIPSYIKDVVDYVHDPMQTLENKAHPLVGMAGELISNHDYYGGIIHDPQRDHVIQSYLNYLLNEATPLAVRSAVRSQEQGLSPLDQVANFFGFVQAPALITHPERGAAWQAKQNKSAFRRRAKEQGRVGVQLPDWAP